LSIREIQGEDVRAFIAGFDINSVIFEVIKNLSLAFLY